VVRDVPVLRHSVPYGLVMTRRRGIDAGFLREFDPLWRERQEVAERAFDALPRAPWLVIVDPKTRLCQPDSCKIEADGEALYRDTNHLSVRGAGYVSDSLAGCFADLR
jgi:SGNH domain (fused to AT3 domains)